MNSFITSTGKDTTVNQSSTMALVLYTLESSIPITDFTFRFSENKSIRLLTKNINNYEKTENTSKTSESTTNRKRERNEFSFLSRYIFSELFHIKLHQQHLM